MADRPILTTSGATKTGETVDVFCKLPHGVILRLCAPVTISEPVMGGGTRDRTEYRQLPESVILNGWAHKKEESAACLIVNGFAVTADVSREFMDRWLLENKDHSAVRAGLIFISRRGDIGEAQNRAVIKSGLEALDKDSPTPGVRQFDGKKEAA